MIRGVAGYGQARQGNEVVHRFLFRVMACCIAVAVARSGAREFDLSVVDLRSIDELIVDNVRSGGRKLSP